MTVMTIDERLRLKAGQQVDAIIAKFRDDRTEVYRMANERLGLPYPKRHENLDLLAFGLSSLSDREREERAALRDRAVTSAHEVLAKEFLEKVQEISERQDDMADDIAGLLG